MYTTFFTDEKKERFYTAFSQLRDANDELVALHAKAEVEQKLQQAAGFDCEVLNDFVEIVGKATDSLYDADNELYWVSMYVEDEEDEDEEK